MKLLNAELKGETVYTEGNFPVILGNTMENLKSAAAGENEEWTELYPEFAKIAREEGFEAIAKTFENISEVEKRHEARYNKLAKNMEEGKEYPYFDTEKEIRLATELKAKKSQK